MNEEVERVGLPEDWRLLGGKRGERLLGAVRQRTGVLVCKEEGSFRALVVAEEGILFCWRRKFIGCC